MRTSLSVAPLLACLALSSSALAADRFDGPVGRRFAGTPTEAARAYLRSDVGPAGLGGVALEARAQLPSAGATTVRFEQRHEGVPVLGGEVAVRVDEQGRVLWTVAGARRGLSVSTTPTVSAEAAVAVLRGLTQVSADQVNEPHLAVLPDEQEASGGRLVWQIDAWTRLGGERFLIDAQQARLVGRRPLAKHAMGRVYKISYIDTPKPSDEPLLDLDPATPLRLNAYKGLLSVYEYKSGGEQSAFTGSQNTAPTSGEDFLYDPPSSKNDKTDAFAVVNSYYHIHRIRAFYNETLNVDMSDPSWDLGVVANARDGNSPLDNAFFSPMGLKDPPKPNMIGIGQGYTADFAYSSDVFMHEFTHYVSDNAIGYNEGQFGVDKYGISPFGGSIDEGISDYFACTVNDDSVLGEGVLGSQARDLADYDGRRCPDGLIGEVHEDGKLIGSAAWEIRQELGAALADQLIWAGFSMLVKGTSLQDFADNVTKAAQAMVDEGKLTAAQLKSIQDIFDLRGLYDCGRVLSLNTGDRETLMFGLDIVGQQYFQAGCGQLKQFDFELQSNFHYSYKPEPGAKSIRFEVLLDQAFGGFGSDELDWGIYVQKGKTVPFSISGQGLPKVGKANYKVEGLDDTYGSIELGEGTDNDLDPDATYFVVIVHKNCPAMRMNISASSSKQPAGQGGGGASAGGAGGKSGSSGQGGKGGAAGKAGAGGKGGAAGKAGGPPGLGGAGGASNLGAPSSEGVLSVGGGNDCGCQAAGATTSGQGLAALAALAGVCLRRRRRAA